VLRRALLAAALLAWALPLPSASADDATCFANIGADLLSARYVAQHANGATENVTLLNLTQGDNVTATLEIAGNGDCDHVPFRLAAFERVQSNENQLFDESQVSGNATDGQPFTLVLGPVAVPSCFFEVDLFLGEGPTTRLLDSGTGGSDFCGPGPFTCPQPAATPAPGSITLTWDAVAHAESYNVYRAEGGGARVLLGDVLANGTEPLSFVDGTVVAGHTYLYTVTAVGFDRETTGCNPLQATASTEVPVFPTAGAALLASAGGVAVALLVRRRG